MSVVPNLRNPSVVESAVVMNPDRNSNLYFVAYNCWIFNKLFNLIMSDASLGRNESNLKDKGYFEK